MFETVEELKGLNCYSLFVTMQGRGAFHDPLGVSMESNLQTLVSQLQVGSLS